MAKTATLKLVNGASMQGMQLIMRKALKAAETWMIANNRSTVIVTCGTNGEHSAGSLHYYGYAIDLRNKHLSKVEKKSYFNHLYKQLSKRGFYVHQHYTHIHIGYNAIISI